MIGTDLGEYRQWKMLRRRVAGCVLNAREEKDVLAMLAAAEPYDAAAVAEQAAEYRGALRQLQRERAKLSEHEARMQAAVRAARTA